MNVSNLESRSRFQVIGWIVIGIAAAACAFAVTAGAALMIIAALAATGALIAVTKEPARWIFIFFAVDLLTPPLPVSSGSANFHLAPIAMFLGIFAGVMQRCRWRVRSRPLLIAAAAFCFSLFASLPFGFMYSGPVIGTASAMRLSLFGIGMYVLAWTACGPGSNPHQMPRSARVLFAIAVAAASIACFDFYFHLPAPAGFSDQYVWVASGVYRRAQGLFYDAGALGNFCALFLTYAVIAMSEHKGGIHPPRIFLAAGGLILGAAMMLSYSRASVLNVGIALIAYATLRGRGGRKIISAAALLACAIAAVTYILYPEFAANYWSRMEGTVRFAGERPDGVLSGRLTAWGLVGGFVAAHPWQTIFGIGYKTLPYTAYLGDPAVADNTYLSLLVETGIAGLGSFLVFLSTALKTALRISRTGEPNASFLGVWAFCCWCGQAAQMISGDILTYWRVMPAYLWAIAAAVHAADPRGEEAIG